MPANDIEHEIARRFANQFPELAESLRELALLVPKSTATRHINAVIRQRNDLTVEEVLGYISVLRCYIDCLYETSPFQGEYLRKATRARATRTKVELYDAEHPNSVFSTESGRWVTVCEHGNLCNHETYEDAAYFLPRPQTWCSQCGETLR